MIYPVTLDGVTVRYEPTSEPSIWFAYSKNPKTPKVKYRMTGIGTSNPDCRCPARGACTHLTHFAMLILEVRKQMANQPAAPAPPEQLATALAKVAPAPLPRGVAGDLAVHQNNAMLALRSSVEGYSFALQFCDMYAQTAGVPKRFGTKAAMAAALLRGAELGLTPGLSLEWMYTVNGTPGLEAKAVAGIIQRSGAGHIDVIETTASKATVRGVRYATRPGMKDRELVVTWTPEDATKAGTPTTNIGGWRDKLVWKAIARIGRILFPDIIGGMHVADAAGVVIDYSDVPEEEGEYVAPAAAQVATPAKTKTEWGAEFKAALAQGPMGAEGVRAQYDLVGMYLQAYLNTVLTHDEFNAAFEDYMTATRSTPADVVNHARAWHDAERPARPVRREPPEPAVDALINDPEHEAAPAATPAVEGTIVDDIPVDAVPANTTMAFDDLPFE